MTCEKTAIGSTKIPMHDGKLRIGTKTYSVHQLLFKLFRSDPHQCKLGELIITSRAECTVSK